MSVELAWVERNENGFVVKRSQHHLGAPFVMNTSDGQVVLVVSGVEEQGLSDGEIVLAVASAVSGGGDAVPSGVLN